MQTKQMTQIEKELQDYESEFYEASAEYRQLVMDAAIKRADYDVAFAQEMLKVSARTDIKMTVPEKEATIVVIVANQLKACRIAEAMALGAKERLRALQSNLTSLQTRASLLGTERSLVNMMHR